MPSTPSLNITNQADWDRVYAAFHGSAAEYKDWLRRVLAEEVVQREVTVELERRRTEVETSLGKAT